MGLVFEWDRKKATQNLRKHKVSFDEAKTIFNDPDELMISDPDHSDEEERLISIGLSVDKRVLLVCYTESNSTIRIISAREAELSETTMYQRS